ncbi:MAG: 1,4-alpha-glucan branching protein domain-containing protein [Solirubrobacterales bacterium]
MPEPSAPARPAAVGELAIVLHSHMPYVEGYGTYPFGEEWLFDAVIHSHLPVLEVARDITMTVTPVLADQLEADGVSARLREFLVEHRIDAAVEDVNTCDSAFTEASAAGRERYSRSLELLDAHQGQPLDAFLEAAESGRVELMASSATHAVLPMLATDRGLDLQVGTGIASHRRRFGWSGGFWLPECAYEPGLEDRLVRHGVEWFCTDQSAFDKGDEALVPVGTDAGPVAFTIDWPAVSWLWDMSGYPSWPGYLDFHSLSMNGVRIFRIDGKPYDREIADEHAREQAVGFLAAAAERLEGFRDRTGSTGLMVFACDCELLGHWWAEGPVWLDAVLKGAASHGIELTTLGNAAAARSGGESVAGGEERVGDEPGAGVRPLRSNRMRASTWGEQKDFRTWDSPAVADLASGARRLELAVNRAVASGVRRDRAERAVRELLAVQSSDWAFIDGRGQAGDYAFERSIGHAAAAFEAIDSIGDAPVESRVRSLAPDLDLAPLLVP